MKKLILFSFLFLGINSFSQIQLGSNIVGAAVGDDCGRSVSLSSDGMTVAIGSPLNDFTGSNAGLVRVYEFNTGTMSWEQLGNDIYGDAADDEFGRAVSISGDGSILAIGAPYNDGNGIDSGLARMYTYNTNTNTWDQLGSDIQGAFNSVGMAITGDRLGYAVSLSSDGSTVAISSPFYQLDDGRVHVYSYNTNTSDWELVGSEILCLGGSWFGFSVSLSSDGGTLAIGLPRGFVNGATEIYTYNTNTDTWEQKGSRIVGETTNDDSGTSVSLSLDGSVVAVGAPFNSGGGPSSGHVRVHAYNNNTGDWEQLGNDIDGESFTYDAGVGLGLSGDGSIVAVGERGGNGTNGQARIFRYNPTLEIWEQLGMDIDGEIQAILGTSMSVSADGSIVAIGGPTEGSTGVGPGYVGVYSFEEILSTDSVAIQETSLYPNPTKDQFTIQLNEGIQFQKADIYNQLGQFVLSSSEAIVDVSNLSQGMYFVEVFTDQGKSTRKLIID